MKRKQALLVALVVLLGVSVTTTLTLAQGPTEIGQTLAPLANAGTAFTYQGQLKQGSTPVIGPCDFQFGLWNAASLGSQVGTTVTVASVNVTNGLFTAPIDFGANAFNGEARWLASAVRCPAASGSYTPLAPRQALTPAPLALALPGLYTQQTATSPNLIGGYSGNFISATVVGSVIGGGGRSGLPNRVQASYATVGGGLANTASNEAATIGGGYGNTVGGYDATIGGGEANTASGFIAIVGGGLANTASGPYATVGGGAHNTAGGSTATIPGGSSNAASGVSSLAAGYRAKANHSGAFVWADSTNADFASTAADQFLVRASGGVGINTNSPTANTLTVGGDGIKIGITGTTFAVAQSGTATLGAGGGGVNVYTVTFPSAFSAPPQVLVTIRSDPSTLDYPDTFAVTTRNVLTSQFRVNVYRVDVIGGSWTQPLKMDWVAWNQ